MKAKKRSATEVMDQTDGHERTKGGLCAVLLILLPDFDEYGLVHQFTQILAAVVNLVLVAERRVASHDDALGLVELAEFILLQPGMPVHASLPVTNGEDCRSD